MSYLSIDELQRALAAGVFQNRQDVKKAAGRALGTLVELITFYLLRGWNLGATVSIELSLPEFGNTAITHNVEFGLHPIISSKRVVLPLDGKSITTARVLNAAALSTEGKKTNVLLSSGNVQRNACVLVDKNGRLVVANLLSERDGECVVEVATLRKQPFAMVECKRVGVEEGMKKGPTTIEKAKQGAYVAKHVSSLQKVRTFDGQQYAALARVDGTIHLTPWKTEIKRLVYEAHVSELAGFVLTVGIVSNHGNWFTSDDPNKELLVLKQSYDWLLFLNDGGIAEFVGDTMMSTDAAMASVRDAFHNSYVSGISGSNVFTKVKISYEAHKTLERYFQSKMKHIESTWFSVLSPKGEPLSLLRSELETLRDKAWT